MHESVPEWEKGPFLDLRSSHVCLYHRSLMFFWSSELKPGNQRHTEIKIIQWGRIIKSFTPSLSLFFCPARSFARHFVQRPDYNRPLTLMRTPTWVIPSRYKTNPGHCLKMIVWIWICIMLALFHQHSWDLHNRVLQRSPQLRLVIFHSKLVFWKKEEKTNIYC